MSDERTASVHASKFKTRADEIAKLLRAAGLQALVVPVYQVHVRDTWDCWSKAMTIIRGLKTKKERTEHGRS